MLNRFCQWGLLWILLLVSTAALAASSPAQQQFLAGAFAGEQPAPELLWLTAERRDAASEILGHRPAAMRVRYWQQAGQSAWILEEIGKEELITVGFLVSDEGIQRLRVLVYRESRGGEVRYDFFTQQFLQSRLSPNLKLERKIDGISGATLSVRALTRLARLALYYHGQLQPR